MRGRRGLLAVWAVLLLCASGSPHAAGGALTALVVPGMSPPFDPAVTQYTVPQPANCSVPVTATLADLTHKLYIASGPATSGVTRNAWLCDGRTKVDIVIYRVWTEVGRYTVTAVPATAMPSPTPAPTPAPASTPAPSESAPQPTPVSNAPLPLPVPSPVDRRTAVTFLQQASFGPTAADVAFVQANGPEYWLAQQFQAPETAIPDGLDVNALRARVFLNMAGASDQLRQRVAFALGQTLVVSANKNVNGFELIPWVRLLSRYAFSNYRTLLREVTLSPTMGKFLDLANSRMAMNGSAPNENYPRELLQLFSIGIWQLNQDGSTKTDAQGHPIPTYSQTTVREVARALTGWTYPTAPGATPASQNPERFVGLMEPRPAVHDAGAKTFFGRTLPAGQTVTKDMEDVIDTLFQHPNVPPFVATRLIRSLVTSNPSPGYITRVANVFVNDGSGVRGNMRAVIRAILTDQEAAVAGSGDGRLKDPLLHVIGLGRALGAQITDPYMFLYVFTNLGQVVLTPPTVFSFYSPLAGLPGHPGLYGPEFQIYTPAQAIQRANFIYAVISGATGSSFRIDRAPYVALAGNPQGLVELVNQTLFFGSMSGAVRQVLVTSAQSVSSPDQRAIGVLYLAAIASEFAVHTGGTP